MSKRKKKKSSKNKKAPVSPASITEIHSLKKQNKVENSSTTEILQKKEDTCSNSYQSNPVVSSVVITEQLENGESKNNTISQENFHIKSVTQQLKGSANDSHNFDVFEQNYFTPQYIKEENKKSFGGFLLILAGVAFVCFFIVKGNEKSVSKKANNSSIVEYNKPDAKKLTCTLEDELEDGIIGVSQSIYIFRNDILIQVIDEESVVFSDDALKYYSYYEKGVKEELEDNDLIYDNTILEMKKDSHSVGLLYSIDLTADSKNPNNSLQLLGTTYDEAKESFESEGYTCK